MVDASIAGTYGGMKTYSIAAFEEAASKPCPKCNGKNYMVSVQTTTAGNQIFPMRCVACNHFIKFLAVEQSAADLRSFVLPIGMHAGKTLADIPLDYLHWAASNLSNRNLRQKVMSFLASMQ